MKGLHSFRSLKYFSKLPIITTLIEPSPGGREGDITEQRTNHQIVHILTYWNKIVDILASAIIMGWQKECKDIQKRRQLDGTILQIQ